MTYSKAYYEAHRQEILDLNKRWRENNRESWLLGLRSSWHNNKDEYNKKRREDRPRILLVEQARKAKAPHVHSLYTYKRNAGKRKIEWSITDEQAFFLMLQPCFYCGAEPKTISGIDRMDPASGYAWSNVVPCCTEDNMSKQSMTSVEYFARCAEVGRHSQVMGR